MRQSKYAAAIVIAVLTAVVISAPVLAAYYANITVTESESNSYDMLPVAAAIDIDYLATNGFIESDGRDVRVKTGGGAEIPFMLVDDKVLFASSIDADRQNAFRLSTDNSLIDDFSIVTGYGGYITTADHANLELSNDFEIELDGYLDTSGDDTYIDKSNAFSFFADSGDIVAGIYGSQESILQTGTGEYHILYGGSDTRAGQRIDNFATGYISQVSFSLMKTGSPTGTAYARVRTVSGDSIVGTLGSIDVSTLTGSYVWYDFTTPVYNLSDQDLRFTIEYDGGAPFNYIRVQWRDVDMCDGVMSTYDGSWTDYSGDDMTFKLYWYPFDAHVSTTVASGEYTVIVGADATDLYIKIDGDTKDTDTLSGASVPDNANDFIVELLYCNDYKLTTSDTLRLTYDPDDIISGTTLPNELAAGTYDGTITYGSEPSGVSVSVGGLETTAVAYATDADGTQDIIAPTTAPLFDVNLERLAHNPLQPIVAVIAAECNLTERLVWLGSAFILLFIVVVYVLWKTEGSITFTAFSGLGYCVIMYLLGIFPLWTIIVFGIGAVASLVYERVIAL